MGSSQSGSSSTPTPARSSSASSARVSSSPDGAYSVRCAVHGLDCVTKSVVQGFRRAGGETMDLEVEVLGLRSVRGMVGYGFFSFSSKVHEGVAFGLVRVGSLSEVCRAVATPAIPSGGVRVTAARICPGAPYIFRCRSRAPGRCVRRLLGTSGSAAAQICVRSPYISGRRSRKNCHRSRTSRTISRSRSATTSSSRSSLASTRIRPRGSTT